MKAPNLLIPMKNSLLTGLALLALAFVPQTLRADHGDTSQLVVKASLQPTADAPAGAKGKAELESKDSNGQSTGLLKVETEGLAPDTYSVSVLLKSNSTSVTLGSLVVTGSSESEDSQIEDSDNQSGGGRSHSGFHADQGLEGTEASAVFGGADQPFPDGFDPTDIGTISVADSNSVVMLTGDLSASQSMLKVSTAVVGGIAAPNAQGKLTITAKRRNGVEKSVITLFARKVPAKTAFTVNVNGTAVAQGVTTKNGMVRLGQTPGKHKGFAPFGQGLSAFDLQSITLTDATDDVILSATP
jgi:hypothetical protein